MTDLSKMVRARILKWLLKTVFRKPSFTELELLSDAVGFGVEQFVWTSFEGRDLCDNIYDKCNWVAIYLDRLEKEVCRVRELPK